MHDSLSQEEEGSETHDESTSSRGRGGGGVMDEQKDGLDRLTDLDMMCMFDLTRSCGNTHRRHLPPAMLATR